MTPLMRSSSGSCIRHCRLRTIRSGGFTYLGLLILLAVIGVASTATLQVGSVLQRRAAEEELLEIGTEFRSALLSYADATPVGQPRSPKTLKDLVKDPRYPSMRHHLRKVYADPMTGKEEWGVVQGPDGGGIIGVYSLSTARPIKIGNFDVAFQGFGNRKSYREWVFGIPAQPNAVPVPETP
jgi:type II secretory pathway pseudopilin PulG